MRRQGERFLTRRVIVPKEELNLILKSIKHKDHLSWRRFAEKLGVSEHTLSYEWRKSISTLPIAIVAELEQLSGKKIIEFAIKDAFWGQKSGGGSTRRTINKPEQTPEFAEFYGALLGDGHLNSTGISITCNKILDHDYVVNYLSNLVEKLFKIKPKIYEEPNENTIRLVINSLELSEFLQHAGFPKGNKNTQNPTIPETFFKDCRLLISCLRGLLDTDGGIYPHPNSKIMLDFTSINKLLLESVSAGFKILNLNHGITKNKIQVYGAKNVEQVWNIIGSSNLRNRLRFLIFKEKGIVPSAKETESLLKATF